MGTDPLQPLELFYCYARRDRALRDELHNHLASLRKSGLITTWHNGEIVPGTHREQEIETHLEAAHVILLLVSPDFIASESCYSKEMKRAIERHHRKEARVIPILLRATDWTGTPFSTLQMLPSDRVPVTSWSNHDEAFLDVARGIRRAVDSLLSRQTARITLPLMRESPSAMTGMIQESSTDEASTTVSTTSSLLRVESSSENTAEDATENAKKSSISQNSNEATYDDELSHKRTKNRGLPGECAAILASFWPKGRPSRKFSWLMVGSLALVAIILLLYYLMPQYIDYIRFQSKSTTNVLLRPTPTPNVPFTIGPDGIGVALVDGEYIGISDGRYALDINRDAGPFMLEASESLRNENLGNALAEWNAAHEKDTNDAEPLIYEEDQRVLISGSPYITIVLGVPLGVKVDDGFSRDTLQAAYIVQMECNDNPQLSGGKKLRLLIARSGSNPNNSQVIARQIVKAAQFDKTIVGVHGWTTSLTTLNVVKILASAHLPIVAGDTASDELTGISPYFFRIGTPSAFGTPFKANYIEKELSPQRLVIFRDHTDPYSNNSAADFAQQFTKDGYHIASIEDFKTTQDAQNGKLVQHVQDILKNHKPDFLFLATAAVGDVTTVLNTISATPEYAGLKVFAGGAGYELVQSGKKINGYAHMLMASSAFPDEWSILDSGNQELPFFNDYSAAYDPHNQHIDFPYAYRRANGDTMIDYDALYTFLVGSKIAIQQGKQDPTPEDVKNALSQIHGSQSFQGITGAIAFGSNGDPINKLRFILRVADDGQHLHVAAYQGCLLVNSDCDNSIHILE